MTYENGFQRSMENITDVVEEINIILQQYNEESGVSQKINKAFELYKLFSGKQNKSGEVFQALRKKGMTDDALRDLDKKIFGHQNSATDSIANLLFDLQKGRFIKNTDNEYQPTNTIRKSDEAINIEALDQVMTEIAQIISTKDQTK